MNAKSYRMPVTTASQKVLRVRALDLHAMQLKCVGALTLSFEIGTITDGIPYSASEEFTMSHQDFIRSELAQDDFIDIFAIAAVDTYLDIAIMRR